MVSPSTTRTTVPSRLDSAPAETTSARRTTKTPSRAAAWSTSPRWHVRQPNVKEIRRLRQQTPEDGGKRSGETDERVAERADLAADLRRAPPIGVTAIPARRRAPLAGDAAIPVPAIEDHLDVGLGGELAG